MPFRLLAHTADVRAACSGASVAELLESAAEALYALAFRERGGGCDAARVVEVAGGSTEELLVRWLQELIYLMDAERFVATSFEFVETTPVRVQAALRGVIYTPSMRAEEVKAATYHGMHVHRDGAGYEAEVIFDV